MPVDVGQVADRLERRPALEVDQEERHPVGRMAPRHRREPGQEELALAAAGGAGDDRVRPASREVELEDALGGHADGHSQGCAGAGRRRRLGERGERHAFGQRGSRSDPFSDRRRVRGRRPRAGFGRGEQLGHDRATRGALAAPLDVRAGGRLHLDDRLEPRRQAVDPVDDRDRRRVSRELAARAIGRAARIQDQERGSPVPVRQRRRP